MQVMQQETFPATELSCEKILLRKVFFISCFEQDYNIHFKQKANQIHSTQQPAIKKVTKTKSAQ